MMRVSTAIVVLLVASATTALSSEPAKKASPASVRADVGVSVGSVKSVLKALSPVKTDKPCLKVCPKTGKCLLH